MIFFVIELQDNGISGAALPYAFTDELQAEAQYHTLLAAAAMSQVPVHTVTLIRGDGFVIKSESYDHRTAE